MTAPRWTIDQFINDLKPVKFEGGAVVVIDMINGFVHEGPLSGPRVAKLMLPIRRFVQDAKDKGARPFISVQDTHRHDALEFESFPAHAVRGTKESQMIPELVELADWRVFEKDTLNPGLTPGFDGAIIGYTEKRNPAMNAITSYTDTFYLVGNCTDLCVYQTAMHIRQLLNAMHRKYTRVIVPANLVDTYDAPGHDGDFFHKTFLYHMSLNGIEVVKEVDFYGDC